MMLAMSGFERCGAIQLTLITLYWNSEQ